MAVNFLAMEHSNFDELFNKYKDMVYSIAIRYTHNREDALEISQEVFINIYKGLPKFRGECKISTWIYRIAVNQALIFNRSMPPYENMLNLDQTEVQPHFSELSNAINNLNQNDRRRLVGMALERLGGDTSTILTLFYVDEQPVTEIAKILNQTAANVKVKLYRGRLQLNKLLSTMLSKEEIKSLI
jgi:RNA polymerase sigma-70 factor (ECF subfamily)